LFKKILTILTYSSLIGFIYAQVPESTKTIHLDNVLEVRYGLEAIDVEYRYAWFPFLSTDITLRALRGEGVSVGFSLYPLPFFSMQTCIGLPMYESIAVDGPAFKPDYLYGLRIGVLVPVGPRNSPFMISISSGKLLVVDRDFCYNCGGFPPAGEQIPEPRYRNEIERIDLFALGLAIRF
jgi:hypothetical protein